MDTDPTRKSLETVLDSFTQYDTDGSRWMHRIRSEIRFSAGLAELHRDVKDEWNRLIWLAAELVRDRLPSTSRDGLPVLVADAESILAPIGKAAKQHTVHCCGHAHIDMNWTWPLAETIATAHDTYATLDRLMDLFPDLKFCQSQTYIYELMRDYCPEVWERIKQRISEGLWQVAAGSWVEGDRNMASGESLCRHVLYSKRWLRENLGLPYGAVKTLLHSVANGLRGSKIAARKRLLALLASTLGLLGHARLYAQRNTRTTAPQTSPSSSSSAIRSACFCTKAFNCTISAC